MAIAYNLYVQDDVSYAPDDISFSEEDSVDIQVNGRAQGFITTFQIVKRLVTLTAKGLTSVDLSALQNLADETKRALIQNRVVGADIDFGGGWIIESAYLNKSTPSAPQFLEGLTIFSQIENVYKSLFYS